MMISRFSLLSHASQQKRSRPLDICHIIVAPLSTLSPKFRCHTTVTSLRGYLPSSPNLSIHHIAHLILLTGRLRSRRREAVRPKWASSSRSIREQCAAGDFSSAYDGMGNSCSISRAAHPNEIHSVRSAAFALVERHPS